MPMRSHLHHLFNAEQCQAYIRTLSRSIRRRWFSVKGITKSKASRLRVPSTRSQIVLACGRLP
jgi:hypothetical protein